MELSAWDRKKEIESAYLNEAQRASDIFPLGKFVAHENPDFLITANGRTYGIEVTELCLEQPRTEAATFQRIPELAKAIHNLRIDAVPVDVSIVLLKSSREVAPKSVG